MAVKFEVVAKTGTYTNHAGEEKSSWLKCGAVFEGDSGQLSLKIDAVPVGSDWNGWFSLFPPKPKGERQASAPDSFSGKDLPF
tara:strand:+ start:2139 stop:2387 length:249 start_codon:yes stop_codon:yes gene_type:complete